MRLIIATKNEGKLREIKKILKGIDLSIISLNELDKKFKIKETGKTFLENAFKKTVPVSKVYRDDYVAGEDSGLEVSCLCGKPGIFSKRYSGQKSTDRKNNLKILKELQKVEGKDRHAYFCCQIALVKNEKLIKMFAGRVSGFISKEMKGDNGFGYDPIFYLPKYKKTAAQLPMEEKNKISHRAKAFRKLRKYLLGERPFI